MAFVYEEISDKERDLFMPRFEQAVEFADTFRKNLNVCCLGFSIPECWTIDRENDLLFLQAGTSLYGDRECAAGYEFTRFLFTKDGTAVLNTEEDIFTCKTEIRVWEIYVKSGFPVSDYNFGKIILEAYGAECVAVFDEINESLARRAERDGEKFTKEPLRINYKYYGDINFV